VSLPAEILTIATSDPRAAVRRTLRLQVNAELSGDAVEAEIRNLSEKGLLVETTADLVIGEILHLDLPEAGIIEATVVWSRGRLFGCEFKAALSKRIVSAALLRSPDERLGRDAAGPTVHVSTPEEDPFGNEIDDSSLPVLVISLVVLILAAIIGVYALFQALSAPH
jgi:hypothetical protein